MPRCAMVHQWASQWRLRTATRANDALADEGLGAEDGEELEPSGVLAAGIGRVDHDA